jgi:hypothetical protein
MYDSKPFLSHFCKLSRLADQQLRFKKEKIGKVVLPQQISSLVPNRFIHSFVMAFRQGLLRNARPANVISRLRIGYGHTHGALNTSPVQSELRLAELDASKLHIARTANPKSLYPKEDLVFGRNFTDHMLKVEWTAQKGWAAPEIVPYQKICLDPATCVFHYGIECFEGQKAYRAADGTVRMFRCDLNMARLNKSAARLALPTVNSEQLEALLKTFVRLEDRFIPQWVSYLQQAS